MSSEKTTFYGPGTLTTWFKKVFRLPSAEEERPVVTPTLAADRREHHVVSKAAAVERRRAALMAAYRAAEALETEPLDEAAVVARLTALRDSIPEREELAVEVADPLTPAERRAIEWHATE